MSTTNPPLLHKLYIHLADDEWGSELMARLAAEALADPRYAASRPLVVSVHEHAGWWLEFALLAGRTTIVGTANDGAVFRGAASRFRDQYQNANVALVGIIRREAKTPCPA